MTIAMRHLRLGVLTEALPDTSLVLARLGSFAVDERDWPDQGPEVDLDEHPADDFRKQYRQTQSKWRRLLGLLPEPVPLMLGAGARVDEAALQGTKTWLEQAIQHCLPMAERVLDIDDQLRETQTLRKALQDFHDLDLNLADLQGDKQFIRLLVGVLPRSHLEQLQDALQMMAYELFAFSQDHDSVHVIVVGLNEVSEQSVLTVLDAADFQALEIPEAWHAEPERIEADLNQREQDLLSERQSVTDALALWQSEQADALQSAVQTLALAKPFVEMETTTRSKGSLALIRGWLPESDLAALESALQHSEVGPYHLSWRKPHANEITIVPSQPTRRPWLRPFASLMQQYGTPRYGEFDPTWVFAISFLLMFGSMFGDIGHGLVIALSAFLIPKRWQKIRPFVVGAGLSATVFGGVYGSIFGYEHVIAPWWMSPLHDPVLMLEMALGWGVLFLSLATGLKVYNHIRAKAWLDAMLDPGAGFSWLMYAGLLLGLFNLSQGQSFGWPVFLVLLPLGFIVLYLWQRLDSPFGERLLVVAIEVFELVMGYVSHSLSFLRVAAFSLNHVALALAVFALADMASGWGHVLALVAGNVFILVLEGAIVTIQVLRLEYYEGLSRYFHGDGAPYHPLTLPQGGGDS